MSKIILLTDDNKIERSKLTSLANEMFGNLIKAVVDVNLQVLALNAELHSDLEAFLLNNGSRQQDLWGINLYPELSNLDFIEFDSMINLRPSQNNTSRSVDDLQLQSKIRDIVAKLITP